MAKNNGKLAETVKVGAKGQIVIPQEMRTMFGIEPGTTLLLLADPQKGIAIVRNDVFAQFTASIIGATTDEPVDPDA